MYFLSSSCGITSGSSSTRASAFSSSSLSGCERWWFPTTNFASRSSDTGSTTSFTTQRMSNREMMGSVRSTFCANVSDDWYFPLMGLAAAMTAHRAWSEVTMPALEIEMVCCSIASWIEVRSWSFILSNSSIRQTPWSASTSAPPWSVHSLVSGSRATAAVRPTAEAPCPVVKTARGHTRSVHLRNCDFAVPGSPTISTLMSPRTRILFSSSLASPPKSVSARAILMSSCPKIDGAIDLKMRSAMLSCFESARIAATSSSVNPTLANLSARFST
mmetsp:Transcript_32058/g.83971  ORF Transcript_32058/g.83971 Transcript_32058/m.83971 type:complete len:274 (+) Transcript_32058:976-1797(+)